MKKIFKRFREWICSKSGHWFTNIDIIIFNIKTNALNRDMTAKIKCHCCGHTFIHKDAPRGEELTNYKYKGEIEI